MAATQAPSELWQEIADLQNQATEAETEARNMMEQAKDKWNERNQSLAQMKELLDTATSSEIDALPTSASAPAPVIRGRPGPKPRAAVANGPVPKHGNAPTPKHNAPAPVARRKPGPKPRVKPAAVAANGKTNRIYGQEMTMAEAVWDVVDRDANTYKQFIPDYPSGANGLKVSEMAEIIQKEGKRASSSANINPMIQAVVADLRYEGKFVRSDDKRYWIPQGAELYGPPLNEDGSPMTEQADGTFHKSDGKVFTDLKGNPVKKRRKRSAGEPVTE